MPRLAVLSLLAASASGLAPAAAPTAARATVSLRATAPATTRRTAGALAFAGFAVGVVGAPSGANAADVNKLNKQLDVLGLPRVDSIPDGFKPCLSAVNQEQSLLVQFNYPQNWLVVKPNTDSNREAGTVSAGDYGKGDSAALFVSDLRPSSDKAYYDKLLSAACTQKGANQIQNFKIKKIAPGPPGAVVDFEYELITGSGFIVERRGVAGVSAVAGKSQALLAITTTTRFKKLGPALRTTAESFRAFEKVATVKTETYNVDAL